MLQANAGLQRRQRRPLAHRRPLHHPNRPQRPPLHPRPAPNLRRLQLPLPRVRGLFEAALHGDLRACARDRHRHPLDLGCGHRHRARRRREEQSGLDNGVLVHRRVGERAVDDLGLGDLPMGRRGSVLDTVVWMLRGFEAALGSVRSLCVFDCELCF